MFSTTVKECTNTFPTGRVLQMSSGVSNLMIHMSIIKEGILVDDR